VRRVRALQNVLLPEAARALREIESALDEFEQDEAAMMRRAALSAVR
jgi:vacuolar-type H+-ATPase subunit D/Vma8